MAGIPASASAQVSAAERPIEPDRPDLTNGANVVQPGQVLFELGGIFTRESPGHHTTGAPIGIRVGVVDWLEARANIDTRLRVDNANGEQAGVGSVQLGAKIRLWPDAEGLSRLSVAPSVTMPRSGDPDVGIFVLSGFDIGPRARLDVNYGIGAIADDGSHFLQHLVSGSLSYAAADRWSPYIELFEISRGSADGTPIVAINTGVLYGLTPRVIIDGGVQFGTSDDAPSFAAFAGLSFAVGRPRRLPTTTSAVPGRD